MKRFTQPFDALSTAERYEAATDVVFPDVAFDARYNLTSGRHVATILDEGDGRVLSGLRWGLIPFWTPDSDVKAGRRMLRARAETLSQRAAFQTSLIERRAIVPIGGWFHSASRDGQKATFYIRPLDGEMWSVAALWDEWVTPTGAALRTLALVTTEPNARLSPLGMRMPAVLRREDEAAWLNADNRDGRALTRLLRPLPSRAMQIDVVRAPRWPAQDDASLIEARSDSAKVLEEWGLEATEAKIEVPRRVVRRDWVSPDGQVFFRSRSWTREDGTRWHPIVDCQHGEVWCDCPDFRFRHARHEPSVHTPRHWCKHLARAIDNCLRHGESQRAS